MTTSTQLPSSPTTSVQRLPLRLRLNPGVGQGSLDGSWWPQSRDLPLEIADLVDNFPAALGQVRRVVFSRPDWDTSPHRVRVARGLMKVGSYPHDDTHQVWLAMMSAETLIRLSVTPPEGSPRPTSPTLVATPAGGDDGSRDETAYNPHWSDDGGSWWGHHPVRPSERI
jgi:hypothetical protein